MRRRQNVRVSGGAGPSGEQRKLVSVVFADALGSTAFRSDQDPEAVRSVMGVTRPGSGSRRCVQGYATTLDGHGEAQALGQF
jgi:hypothetical protein